MLLCTPAAGDNAIPETSPPAETETDAPAQTQPPASDAEQEVPPRPPPFFAPTADLVQRQTTAAVFALSNQLDAFFVDKKVEETFNRSRFRLRFGGQYAEGGKFSPLSAVRLNIDLPGARERLGLFFDRDREDSEEKTPEKTIFNDGDEDLKFSLRTGLRYTLDRGPRHHLQFQVGTRFFPDIEPFSEIRGGFAFDAWVWLIQPTQILFWRDEVGFGETSRLDCDYRLRENIRLRLRGEGTFSESSAGYDYYLSASLAHQLSPRRGIELALDMSGHTRPDLDVVRYGARCTWRQCIYEDWLFVELIPLLEFPQDRDYAMTTAISLLLEANFGNWSR